MSGPVLIGVLWGGGSAVGFALYQIVNRRLVHQASIYRTVFLSLSCSVAIGILLVPLLEKPQVWQTLTGIALLWFVVSGLFHFSLGWTLLSYSQRSIGAARASPLTSSSVVLSAVFGTLFLGEPLNATLLIGVVFTVLGVFMISRQSTKNIESLTWRGVVFALLTGACWALSPVFFHWGYALVPSAFIAVLASLCAGAAVSGVLWLANRNDHQLAVGGIAPLPPSAFWSLQVVAGFVVGLSIFARWISLVYLPIVSVNALGMLTVPMVVVLAPLLLDRGLERGGRTLWLGTFCALGGVGLTLMGGA